MASSRTPAKFYSPLAIGAPEPYRALPVRLERMIHFIPPHNEKIRAKIKDARRCQSSEHPGHNRSFVLKGVGAVVRVAVIVAPRRFDPWKLQALDDGSQALGKSEQRRTRDLYGACLSRRPTAVLMLPLHACMRVQVKLHAWRYEGAQRQHCRRHIQRDAVDVLAGRI